MQIQQPPLAKQRTLKDQPSRPMIGSLPHVSQLDQEMEPMDNADYDSNLDQQQQQQYLRTNDEQEDRCISSQRLSDKQLTLHINRVVSSQDQSEEANHLLVLAPNMSSHQVLLACASSGDIRQVAPVSRTDELYPQDMMHKNPVSDQRIAPVIIDMQTYKLPPLSVLIEKSQAVDTVQANSQRELRHLDSSCKIVDQNELDCLMSVADNFSDVDESKLTNRTSQNPSALLRTRLEPTMSAGIHQYRDREINNGSMLNNSNISNGTPQDIRMRDNKPFQGRTLLQKIQYAGQPERTWQMDVKTGQILVKDSTDLNKGTTLYSQQNPSSMLESQIRRTLESPADPMSANKSSRHGSIKQKTTLVADSFRKISSLRQTTAGDGSTLVKQSRELDLEQSNLMNSLEPGSTVQLDSPGMIPKSFTRKKPVITISGQQPSEEYLRYMGSLPSTVCNQPTFKLRANLQRYAQGHKRVQSANLHSQASKSRQSGNLYPIVRTANTINECSSKQLRVSHGVGFQAAFRTNACTSVRTGGVLEPHNLTIDFNTLPADSQASTNQARVTKQKMTKSGRPASSGIQGKASQRFRQKSPHSQHLDAATTVQSFKVDSYHHQNLAEQLLQEEEQIASTELEKEIFSQLIIAVQQDPNMLLKRSKTGASRADTNQVEEILTKAKYDSRQNILLAKNPFIIRQNTFSNSNQIRVEALQQILQVLSKHEASDLSALAQQIPYQLMCAGATGIAGPEIMKEVELSGTNVGDITLQKDANKHALFSFLGRLKERATKEVISASTTPVGQPRKRAPLMQSQITRRLMNGSNKRRRMWSQKQLTVGHSAQAGRQGTAQVGREVVHRVDIKTEEQPMRSVAPQAAIVEAKPYDTFAKQMLQVNQSGESHKSTFLGSAIAIPNEQSKPDYAQPDQFDLEQRGQYHTTQLRQSCEGSLKGQEPGAYFKNKQAVIVALRKSYEPIIKSSQVQVQSIQIAVDGNMKNKSSYEMRNLCDSHSSEGNLRKFGDLVGGEITIRQSNDSRKQQGKLVEQKRLGKSHSFVADLVDDQPQVSSMRRMKKASQTSDFYEKRDRCLSALPVNKKLSRSGKHIRNVTDISQSQLIKLEVTGRPISHEFSKRSVDGNSSKWLYSPIKEQASVVIEEPYQQTVTPDMKNKPAAATLQTLARHALTPNSQIEDPTPAAKNYLSHRHPQFSYAKQPLESQIKSMLPLMRMQQLPPPLSKTEENSSDYATFMQQSYQKREQKPVTSSINAKPQMPQTQNNLRDRRRNSATETSSRKVLQASVEPINDDLAICNEYQDQVISPLDTKVASGEGGVGGDELQKIGLDKLGATISRVTPQQTTAGARLSFPGSSDEMGRQRSQTRKQIERDPSGIATSTDKGDTTEMKMQASKQDRVRGKRKTELDPPGPDAVEFHLLSHNSTVKMDIVSSNVDGRSELPQPGGKQIISPQSEVYHKTNLTIFQRSKPAAKTNEKMGKNVASGVSLTNFNNHIIFNPNTTLRRVHDNTAATTTSKIRNARVQSAHLNRRNHRAGSNNNVPKVSHILDNRSKQKQQFLLAQQQQQQLKQQQQLQQQQQQKFQTQSPYSNECGQNHPSHSPRICQDCNGIRQSWISDSAAWKATNRTIDPEVPTQFVISAIESSRLGQMLSKGGGAIELAQDHNSSPQQPQTLFTPSEHQFVIEQLQELPIELTQQLVASRPQSTQLASSFRGDNPGDFQQQQNLPVPYQPVKIVGHKGLAKRKKGLSLVQYSRSFLEGQRHKIDGIQTTSNAEHQKKKNITDKAPKRKAETTRNGAIKKGQLKNAFQAPLEVVNSQAMIMEQRRIKTNLDSPGDNKQQQKRVPITVPQYMTTNITRHTVGTIHSASHRRQKSNTTPGSASLRLGIATMMGNRSVHGVRKPSQVDAATHTVGPKRSDLAHLNENSNQMFEEASLMTRDIETVHGGLRFIASNGDIITKGAHPSTGDPICLSNRGGPMDSGTHTNRYFTQGYGSQPESQAQKSHELVRHAQQTQTMGTVGIDEDSKSRLNRCSTTNRRNIISRQSSTKCQQKLTPTIMQRTLILRHSSEEAYQGATYNVLNNSSAVNIPARKTTNDSAIPINFNSQQIQSLSSQRINALELEPSLSDKGGLVVQGTDGFMSKPASDSQPGMTSLNSDNP